MYTPAIDTLYLELSHHTRGRNFREVAAEKAARKIAILLEAPTKENVAEAIDLAKAICTTISTQ